MSKFESLALEQSSQSKPVEIRQETDGLSDRRRPSALTNTISTDDNLSSSPNSTPKEKESDLELMPKGFGCGKSEIVIACMHVSLSVTDIQHLLALNGVESQFQVHFTLVLITFALDPPSKDHSQYHIWTSSILDSWKAKEICRWT